jgi:hypothetical protein
MSFQMLIPRMLFTAKSKIYLDSDKAQLKYEIIQQNYETNTQR